MHLAGKTYEEVYWSFRWETPARFNIAEAICERHAALKPDAPALLYEQADGALRSWSFGEVSEHANRCANVLAHLGVGRGVIVGIHLPQCPESLIVHIAIQKLGAIALPLFTLFGPEAVGYRLADSGARVLITTPAALERTADAVRAVDTVQHVVTVSDAAAQGAHDFWSLLARAAPSAPTAETSADDPALLIYTSGTTGNPKGALHAQRVLIGHLPGVMVPHDFFPKPGDRFWTPADWAWAGGLLDVLFPSLFHGVAVVGSVRAKFEPEWAFDFLGRHGVRNTFMPPTALRLMRQVPNPRAHFAYARALDRHGRREAGRRHDGVGPRHVRPRALRVLRPDRGQPCGRQLAGPLPGARGLHGPRHSGPHRRGGGRPGQRAARRRARYRRRAPARPRHVPRVLEKPRGNGGEVPGRLVPARRRGGEGRRRLLLVPGPRRRHHQLGRLPHRSRRGGGMPHEARGAWRWRA